MTNKPLTIAFDAKRIVRNATGLGNYGRMVVEALARFAPRNRYLLYAPDPGRTELRQSLSTLPQIEFRYPATAKHGPMKALWRSVGIRRELPPDIALFHGLSGELPFGLRREGIRSVVTVHDLIFLRFPDYYRLSDRLLYAWKLRKACREADRIVAISRTTKHDLTTLLGIPDEKIDVVYQGCDERFKRQPEASACDAVRRKYALPEEYILSVGTIEERKNALLLLQAAVLLPRAPHIVLVGRRTPYTRQLERFAAAHGLADRLHVLDRVTNDELPAVYALAQLFVYPSRYEGFGIPMIEAAWCGVPAIGATGSCLEEAGGPDALYVDPDAPQQLADAIGRVLSDEALRRRMIDGSRRYVLRFEPERIAAALSETYARVLAESERVERPASKNR